MIDFSKGIPKAIGPHLEYREEVRKICAKDAGARRAAIAMCQEDAVFFFNTFYWLFEPRPRKNPRTGKLMPKKIPFITRPHQDEAIKKIEKSLGFQDIIGVKSRDEGATWISCGFADRDLCFEDYVSICLISRNREAIYKADDHGTVFWKIKWGYEQLPRWMRGDKGKHWDFNISDLVMTNMVRHGTITGFASAAEAGSGSRTKWGLVDECSKIPVPKDEQILTALQAVTDSRMIIATPRGMGNAYAQAVYEESDSCRFRLMWWQNPAKNRGLYKLIGERVEAVDPENNPLLPQYDPPTKEIKQRWDRLKKRGFDLHKGVRSDWYDRQCDRPRATPTSVAQEQDADFGGSASQVFGSEFLEVANASCRDAYRSGDFHFDKETLKGEFETIEYGPMKLWCELDPSGAPPRKRYAVGADVSTGANTDTSSNSVAVVIDCVTGEQVAEYTSKTLEPNDWADLIMAIGKWFWDAHLNWESNGPGGKVTTRVKERNYSDPFQRNALQSRKIKQEPKLGWFQSAEAKEVLFGDISTEVRSSKIIVRSKDMAHEFTQYVRDDLKGGKIVHNRTGDDFSHGDRVIAFGLAIQCIKQRPVKIDPETDGLKGEHSEDDPPINTMAYRENALKEAERRDADDWDDRGPAEMMGLTSLTGLSFDQDFW